MVRQFQQYICVEITTRDRPAEFEVKESSKKSQEDLMPDYDSDEDYDDEDDSDLKVDSMGNYIYPDEDDEEEVESES